MPNSDRSVFLVGFMAAGKTTVGELAARRLGLPFRDLDHEIEAQAGASIASLFESAGEEAFRHIEADALRGLIAGPPAVIATGGGTPCFGDNLDRMRAAGLVVALTAPLERLLPRVADASTRPLLAQTEREIRDLFLRREPIYRQAHACVSTERRTPEGVARIVAELAERTAPIASSDLATSVVVALAGGRAYPVLAQPGALARLGALCRAALGEDASSLGLVCDDNVAPLYGEAARRSLAAAGFSVGLHVVPAGELSKSFDTVAALSEKLAADGLDRGSAIVALGGGVVGDLAGFVASSLFRGIRCVQVPTTLVAMTDSAIGGKTGINLRAGKNLVGAFWQPSLVIADTSTIATLPERERRAAFGELFKYGLLDGDELYGRIDALAGGAPTPDVIRRCAGIKAYIVGRDEREETGERALLNLGHTVGHAIEAAAGFGAVLHAEAVALGLIASCRVSAALGLCSPSLEQRVADSVRRAGLDGDLAPWVRDGVLSRIGVDKKRTGSRIRFVALRDIGQPILHSMELAELISILRAGG